MNTTNILNILTRSLRSGRELIQRKSLASQYECHAETGISCEENISSYTPQTCDGNIVFSVLASGIYPYKNSIR